MPLSEQEQRLLDEMERSLYHGDADFVASVGRTRVRSGYGAVVGGILLALAGIGVLVVGVLVQVWLVGVLGFALMCAGVLAVGGPGRRSVRGLPGAPRGRFMDRLSERWERRRQG